MRLFLCALSCVCLAATPSLAATVMPIQGGVSINHGQGYQPVNGQLQAQPGDMVMVAPEGSATVAYDDGCKVDVKPGAITTIAPLSPCASGSYAQDDGFNWGGVVMGVAAGAAFGLGIYEAVTVPNGTSPASP